MLNFWKFAPKLRPSLEPEGVEAQMHCVSATIGLLSKSHSIEPHHLQSRASNKFFLQMNNNLINLSNCNQEIRQHPRLFLSYNNDSVVLPDKLRPAPPIDFVPLTLSGSRCALSSVIHQHSTPRFISSYSFLPPLRAFSYILLPIALSIFCQRWRRGPQTLKTQLHQRHLRK